MSCRKRKPPRASPKQIRIGAPASSMKMAKQQQLNNQLPSNSKKNDCLSAHLPEHALHEAAARVQVAQRAQRHARQHPLAALHIHLGAVLARLRRGEMEGARCEAGSSAVWWPWLLHSSELQYNQASLL